VLYQIKSVSKFSKLGNHPYPCTACHDLLNTHESWY